MKSYYSCSSPQVGGGSGYKWLVHYNRALRNEKLLFPLFPVGGGRQWLQMAGAL